MSSYMCVYIYIYIYIYINVCIYDYSIKKTALKYDCDRYIRIKGKFYIN